MSNSRIATVGTLAAVALGLGASMPVQRGTGGWEVPRGRSRYNAGTVDIDGLRDAARQAKRAAMLGRRGGQR